MSDFDFPSLMLGVIIGVGLAIATVLRWGCYRGCLLDREPIPATFERIRTAGIVASDASSPADPP